MQHSLTLAEQTRTAYFSFCALGCVLGFLHARVPQEQNPNPSRAPRGGPASVCLSPSSCQERGLERVLRTKPLLAEEVLLHIGLFVAR